MIQYKIFKYVFKIEFDDSNVQQSRKSLRQNYFIVVDSHKKQVCLLAVDQNLHASFNVQLGPALITSHYANYLSHLSNFFSN